MKKRLEIVIHIYLNCTYVHAALIYFVSEILEFLMLFNL
jgi:hypothetical protein